MSLAKYKMLSVTIVKIVTIKLIKTFSTIIFYLLSNACQITLLTRSKTNYYPII